MTEWIYEKNRIYLKNEDNQIVASVDFKINDNVYEITHTNVLSDYRRHGLAGKLMLKVIDRAKKDKFKIKPICSYSVSFFERFDKYQHLLVNY